MRVWKQPLRPQRDSDSVIISRLKRGDEPAFEQVFRRYYKHLYAIGIKFLKNPELAEDAVQDIFLKLWDQRDALKEDGCIKGFLAMRNHVLNVIRNDHRAIWEYLSGPLEETFFENSTANTLQLQEYKAITEQGLKQLPPQQEKIFRMRAFSGMDNDQVAKQLSISVTTVKCQFSQATKSLKDYLSKHADLAGILEAVIILQLADLPGLN